MYNFDKVFNRLNTRSIKFDGAVSVFHTNDVLPMWIADTDFETPSCIFEAIRQQLTHPVLGYHMRTPAFGEALAGWVSRHFDWKISSAEVCFSPGIVPALNLIVQALTLPGDKIVVQPPVYFPFFNAIRNHGREMLVNQLVAKDGKYLIDFEQLETLFAQGARMLFLCSPHNPGGRVWLRSELEQLAALCLKYRVLVLSDEIHADLVYPGHSHIPFASLSAEVADCTITCMAPTKTFNMAGLSTGAVVITNPALRKKYMHTLDVVHVEAGTILGDIAFEAAYNHGDEYQRQLVEYLWGNVCFMRDFMPQNLPSLKLMVPESTFLAWIDFAPTGLPHAEIKRLLIGQARLGLSPGPVFGPGGETFMRLNFGCPRTVLAEALQRMASVQQFR